MRAISLKLAEHELKEADRLAASLGVSRAAYIRRAIERFNAETANEVRAQALTAASHKVRADSMRINAEFAEIEVDPDA